MGVYELRSGKALSILVATYREHVNKILSRKVVTVDHRMLIGQNEDSCGVFVMVRLGPSATVLRDTFGDAIGLGDGDTCITGRGTIVVMCVQLVSFSFITSISSVVMLAGAW